MQIRLSVGAIIVACTLLWTVRAQFLATRFVTETGGAATSCASSEPCSLPRAFALANNGTIQRGETVHVAKGIYSQAQLTLNGSGVQFWFDGATLTGTRKRLPPSAWTLVPGLQYTYVAEHNQAGEFNSSNPAQRSPTNWRPIIVADNGLPQTRTMTLDFPPRYRNAASLEEVERQSCTHYDTATHVYVHFCHDGPPDDATDFWLSSIGWGALSVNGRDNTLDGLRMQHSATTNGNGFTIGAGATNTTLRHFDFRATGITVRGNTQSVIEDGQVGYVIIQGRAGEPGCYDSNPEFGVGECWNNRALGSAVDVAGATVRRVKVHRSWNGMSVGSNTVVEDSLFIGFPNHTFGCMPGADMVVRRSIFLNGQDSFYCEGSNFDRLTVEQNLFVNGTLYWVSRDGKGGTPPTAWSFRFNILPSIVYDDKTFPNAQSDCNVIIESPADPNHDLFRITGTDGAKGRNFNTLKDWQTATGRDMRSLELSFEHWTNAQEFALFTRQDQVFDFHPRPTARALQMASCGNYAGPYGYVQG